MSSEQEPQPEPELPIIKQESDDEQCVWLGSRPGASKKHYFGAEMPLSVDPWPKKRKRKGSTKQGRPKSYKFESTESESEFVLSDLEDAEVQVVRGNRQATRWVVYYPIDDRMLRHWMIQGRSLDYVVKAYKHMRSPNGLYQKMAGLRREFRGQHIKVDKKCHFDLAAEGCAGEGPIPRADLQAFKVRLEEMKSSPQLRQRMSGSGERPGEAREAGAEEGRAEVGRKDKENEA